MKKQDFGSAPNNAEIEVTLFGPGYGEAIAIHTGHGGWLLIDSCLDTDKRPAALSYLKQIGVPLDQVHTIVASHWHDDHVKGLAEVVKQCTDAHFHISAVFQERDALKMILAGSIQGAVQTTGGNELTQAMFAYRANKGTSPITVQHRSIIWRSSVGELIEAVAFSPMSDAVIQAARHLGQYLPKQNAPIGHIPEVKPNMTAIVINLKIGDDAILLGSDLEDHAAFGWTAVVNDDFCIAQKRASTYKVAHHGATTGDHADIWRNLLTTEPVAILTPFRKGNIHLPRPKDRARILKSSKTAYISADLRRIRPVLDPDLAREMAKQAKNINPISRGFGVIRLRRQINGREWTVELFGDAKKLKGRA